MNIKKFLQATTVALAVSAAASPSLAATYVFAVQQDGTVTADGSAGNSSWDIFADWAGTASPDYFAIFGFNTSGFNGSAVVRDVTFTAYHNWSDNIDPGAVTDHALVGAAIGSDNSWNYQTVTAYNALGPVVATRDENSRNLFQWQTWDLGKIALGDYLTIGLVPVTAGWNDYQAVAGNSAYGAYLTVSTGVPEASTWVMLLAGFAALGFVSARRNKSVHAA